MLDPASHEIIPPRYKIRVVGGSSGQDHEDFITDLRRALLVRDEAENPFMRTGFDGLISQVAESLERNLHSFPTRRSSDLDRKSVV